MTHTPGPWLFFPEYKGSAVVQSAKSFGIVAQDPDDVLDDMCIECHSAEGGRAQDETNARLVAAAPEMFDALKRLLWEHARPSGNSRGVQMAQAAIAKATE